MEDDPNNMTMIATVHPFKPNDRNSHFKIEDVTDDPKYNRDFDDEELEGALVEYCRLDSKPQKSPHSICDASTVVSARSNHQDQSIAPGNWKSGTVAKNIASPMAHIIDVEVGQTCSNMATCKCHGFRPHQWR
uniref:Uncharacterized protein n=1 Tax=Acrobeloides nanus TaxID=290746 RepID=A0A914C2J2_9BILA